MEEEHKEDPFEVEEEHVLLQLEGCPVNALTQEGVAAMLEGFPARMDQEMTVLVAGKTYRGTMEPLVGTALVFSGTDTAAPVCVTQSAVLRTGRAKAKEGGRVAPAPARRQGRRKRKPAFDEDDDYEEDE